MTNQRTPLGTDSHQQLLRRFDIIIGILAVIAAFLAVLVADTVSASFVPAFLLTLLFGLGIIAVSRSVLDW